MTGDARLAVGVVALVLLALMALTVSRVGARRGVLVAAARAVVQLTVVGLALGAVIAAPLGAVAILAVMLLVATRTAAGRLRGFGNVWPAATVAVVVGAGLTLALVFAIPVLDRSVRNIVAVSGIVIGGAMTATVLAGRRLLDALRRRREEVEGWLALGATPRQAVVGLTRDAAGESLVPGLDQTRTVGLVTLPGALVGALLGGADPGNAARFQLVVLVSLLAAQALSSTTLVYLLGAPAQLPAAEPGSA